MSPSIKIDDEVYAWLQGQAKPFEDTPNTVLRRIAGLNKAIETEITRRRDPMLSSTRLRGQKVPQGAYREPIMQVLKKLGGQADRLTVLKEVEEIMKDELTDYDRSDISSGTIRWQKSAEFEVFVMRERGLLKQVSETPRGVWGLTSKGYKALEELQG